MSTFERGSPSGSASRRAWARLRAFGKRRLASHPRLYEGARRLDRALRRARGGGLPDAGRVWDSRVGASKETRLRGWLDSEWIDRHYLRPRISGSPDVYYADHFVNRYLRDRPPGRLLSLGSGEGALERYLMELGAATAIEGVDLSPRSVALAQRLAEEQGWTSISYRVADLNTAIFEPERYRAVVSKQALHHVVELEHVLEQTARSLSGEGVLMLHEYVGPDRFQWTERQLELANELFHTLPAWLRRSAGIPDIRRPAVRDVVDDDPSEAVRSSEIMSLLEERFELIELAPLGGTLLHLVVNPVLAALDESDPEHRAILEHCCSFERSCLERGLVGSDFVFAVARPRR